MADKLIEGLKAFVEAFAKQVSLNVLLFTAASVSTLIYMRSKCEIALYIGFGCLVFLITSLLVRYVPKAYSSRMEKKLYKKLRKPRFQRKMLSKLDSYELEILLELYEEYPEPQIYDVDSPVIVALSSRMMVHGSNQLIPLDVGRFHRYYTLQPWVKQALDNNKEFLEKETHS